MDTDFLGKHLFVAKKCFSADPVCNSTMLVGDRPTLHENLIQPHFKILDHPLKQTVRYGSAPNSRYRKLATHL